MRRHLKILHTESSCGWGGQELRILNEATGLAERGHRIALACPPQAPLHDAARALGLQVHALPIGRKRLPGLFAAVQHLRAQSYDIVNTHSSTDSWLFALGCKAIGGPPIVRTRHVSAPISTRRSTRWLYASGAARVVTTGELLRQQVLDATGANPARVISVPTGIDPERYSPRDRLAARQALGLPLEREIVGIVATLRSWKGHRDLIDAIARMQRPNLLLAIVGDGPGREAIAAQVQALGLGDTVLLAGHRPDPAEWFNALDLFILPSYANEGVPQALIQAMLSGLAVLTTGVGAIPDLAVDGLNARYCRPRDPADLALHATELLDDPGLRAQLGVAARRTALERFTRIAMLDQMEMIFSQAAR